MVKSKSFLYLVLVCGILNLVFKNTSHSGTTKEYKFKFQTQCAVVEKGTAFVSSVVRMKNGSSERFLTLTCDPNRNKCIGWMIVLGENVTGPLSVMLIDFKPKAFVISGSKALISYSNETYSIDEETGIVSAEYDFSNNSKPSKDIWIGSCKN